MRAKPFLEFRVEGLEFRVISEMAKNDDIELEIAETVEEQKAEATPREEVPEVLNLPEGQRVIISQAIGWKK